MRDSTSTVSIPDPQQTGLGDQVQQALTRVGITKDRVEQWLGRPCHCLERQAKLNALGFWARRVLKGSLDRMTEILERIMSDDETGNTPDVRHAPDREHGNHAPPRGV